MRYRTYSYRFAEQVLNSKLAIRHEIEEVIAAIKDPTTLSRPKFNEMLRASFVGRGWED